MKTQFQGNTSKEDKFSYHFLKGDFGKKFLEEYNGIVKSDYKDNPNLKVLNLKDNVVKGSNSYSIYLVDTILSQVGFRVGLRTATPSDIQDIIDIDKNFLKVFYVDLGCVLRTKNGVKGYLARQLGEQAKEMNYKFSSENPLVFKPSDLELILDENSNSGLGFKIKESATPFNASELSNKNNNKKFSKTNEKGVPIFDKNGNRTLYTREDGLSRFSLGMDSSLDSRYDGLSNSIGSGLTYSNDNGRVVVIEGKLI